MENNEIEVMFRFYSVATDFIGGGILSVEKRTGAILDRGENDSLLIRDIKNSEVIKNINVNNNKTSGIIEIEFFDKDLKLLKKITTDDIRVIGRIIDEETKIEWSNKKRFF